ncbi:MAG: hypothetical protein L3J98_09170 [Gammaproteobacteria bacterium]|nr:hypothetical protein [Gammaproteobacteria bacterium]
MKDHTFHTTVTDGTAQWQREPLAFRPGCFNVDEMSFEVLLSMASEYAATFSYFNSINQKDGSWVELFNANEAVIMALIATSDVEKIESGFTRFDLSDIQPPAEYVIRVATMLDFWLQRLTAAPTKTAALLRNNIHDIISTNLLSGVHTAAEVAFRSHAGSEIDVSEFSAVWGIASDGERYFFPHAVSVDPGDAECVMEQLEVALLKMTGSIRYLKTLVADMLERSLQSQSHEPAIGLFMVFLRLYEVAQQRLNKFTSRHLGFYYGDCLKTTPRSRQVETLFLEFTPAASTVEFIVDKEIAFSMQKHRSSAERLYHLKAPLLVRKVSVSSLRTLYLQRNSFIFPEYELGYVTRIKSYQRSVLPLEDDVKATSMSLFGGTKKGTLQQDVIDATVGFCIASQVLALKEGRREIEVSIHFTLPDEPVVDAEFNNKKLVDSPKTFRQWFGKIFSYYLLRGESFLNDARREKLRELIAQYEGDGSACATLLQQPWQDLFYQFFKMPFVISLSGESGWLAVKDYLVAPLIEDNGGVNSGLKITLSLRQDIESIVPYDAGVHGGQRSCNSPMMNICLNSEAGFFCYSLLNSVVVKSVGIEVKVTGVKDVMISNHLGRLDPTKPFAPFGPLPSRNSYIVAGSREAARKQVSTMELVLEWGDLPTLGGGFSSHYDGYDFVPLNTSFEAEISVLQDGQWMPQKAEMQYRVAMFRSGRGGIIGEKNVMEIGAAGYFKPLEASELTERYEYRSGARNGFVRLQLASPENAFGHADYPLLLTRVLTENARRKKPKTVPNAPYTPIIREITLNYQACVLIRPEIDLSSGKQLSSDMFFHIHPFGIEQQFPVAATKMATKSKMKLFPDYEDDGNLFIGLDAQKLSSTLTLFFDLDGDTSSPLLTSRPLIRWRYLSASGWSLLEENRVLSDTTEGFLMSGVVTLDLPAGLVNDNALMPSGKFWLQVSVNDGQTDFCGLRAIYCNVGQLSCNATITDSDETAVLANDGWKALKSVPGLAGVNKRGVSVGGQPAEDQHRYQTRISERLCHKGRASTVWDYERLILERFPGLYKVKCFANTVYGDAVARPGNILIVVVPDIKHDASDNHQRDSEERSRCEQGMVNSAELKRIQTFVQGLASPFVRIDIRNPVYEQIQVRCSVKFSGDINAAGTYINRLNRAVSDYICPWRDVGYKGRFGWAIRTDEIESYIRELDYVDLVTNFSMLHITKEKSEKYSLVDTAKQGSRHEALIVPHYPWSLAVPMSRHFIETVTNLEPVRAQLAGVNELEIGSTLIIGGN